MRFAVLLAVACLSLNPCAAASVDETPKLTDDRLAIMELSQPKHADLRRMRMSHKSDAVRLGTLLAANRSDRESPDLIRLGLSDADEQVCVAALMWAGELLDTSLRGDLDVALKSGPVGSVLLETYLAAVENLTGEFADNFKRQTARRSNTLTRTLLDGLLVTLAKNGTLANPLRALAVARFSDGDVASHREWLRRALLARGQLASTVTRRLAHAPEKNLKPFADLLTTIAFDELQPAELRCDALFAIRRISVDQIASPTSLMPCGLEPTMTVEEFRDRMAFLERSPLVSSAMSMPNDHDKSPLSLPTGPVEIVLDSDVFNEVDDQFALSFAVRSTKRISLKAVYAAPFKNHRSTSAKDGMEKSYHEAKRVLGILGVPAEGKVFRGSDRFLPNRDTPVDSEAARHLIRLAHEPREGRLYVVGLGAASNIASAILLDPSIKDRIVVVWIGGHPYSWPHARDFNLNQDIAAAQVLFDSKVPLVHIPAGDVAAKLGITLPELESGMKGRSAISDDLYTSVEQYYREINASKKAPRSGEGAWRKVIWDIATVAWLVGSDSAVQTKVVPSPILTNTGEWQETTGGHHIRVATGLDRNQIFDMLFETLADKK